MGAKRTTNKNSVLSLAERASLAQQGFNDSQQAMLARLKANRESEFEGKLTESFRKTMLMTGADGTTLAERTAAKLGATIDDLDIVTPKTFNELRTAMGEDAKNVKLDTKVEVVDLKEILKEISDESKY